MSETLSAEVTAIATAVLAVFAFITAVLAWVAFRAQSGEVRDQADLLRVQAEQLTLQQRQFDEDQAVRRRTQAAQVFVMIDRDASGAVQRDDGSVDVLVRAHNTSGQPVYDLSGGCMTRDGDFGPPQVRPSLMPGDTLTFQQPWSRPDGISGLDAWLDFRDAAGVHWRITDRGTMTELCGETSPGIDRARCTHLPAHSASHSWE